MNRTASKKSSTLTQRRLVLEARLSTDYDGADSIAVEQWYKLACSHTDDWTDNDYVRELAAYMERLDEKAHQAKLQDAAAERRRQAESVRGEREYHLQSNDTTEQPPTAPPQCWRCDTGRVCAGGPFVEGLPAKARKLGGRWNDDDPERKHWTFPARQLKAVLALWREVHGDEVQVLDDFDEEPDEELDEDPVPDLVTRFNFAFRYEVGGITNVAVLGAIANGMDGKTGVCTYGYKALARMCECSRLAVLRTVADLERRGMILVERRHRKTNRYRLVMDSDSDSGS